jgi:recombination DNA repair RAD52 pathway protein
MSFKEDQITALRAKLSGKAVQTRVVNGFNLSFVEGWYTIEEANRIFGFDAGIGRRSHRRALAPIRQESGSRSMPGTGR